MENFNAIDIDNIGDIEVFEKESNSVLFFGEKKIFMFQKSNDAAGNPALSLLIGEKTIESAIILSEDQLSKLKNYINDK